jgi:hypothetical protein
MEIGLSNNIVLGQLNDLQVLVAKKAPEKYSDSEKVQIQRLKNRDNEVRSHEKKHVRAAQGLTIGDPVYRKIIGPDGKAYAVEGRVQINVSPNDVDPNASLRRAQIIQNSALSPMSPSSADISILHDIRKIEKNANLKLHNNNFSHQVFHIYKNNEHGTSKSILLDIYA